MKPAPEPSVSVIVPVYNAERALPRLILSLKGQDYPADRVEFLLVDNNSTDRSADVIRQHPEVKLLTQTQQQTPGATRNAGIALAAGEVLAFIDADCWAHPRWLSTGIRTLAGTRLDRVAGRVEFVLSQRPNIYEIYDSTLNFRQADFVDRGWCGTGNLFVWKRVFDDIGPFDPELISHEDSEFGERATRAGKTLGYAADAVVYHHSRKSLIALIKKWMRTEYGAAQAYRRHGLHELHLWCRKANYRPLIGEWQNFPPEVRGNSHMRLTIDLMANLLRMAGNLGNFRGYWGL